MTDLQSQKLSQEISSQLRYFEKDVDDWTDVVRVLSRINETLCSSPPGVTLLCFPEFVQRLGQCLSPQLPQGAHMTVLDIYQQLLRLFGKNVHQYLNQLFVPLLPLYPQAKIPTKKKFLQFIKTLVNFNINKRYVSPIVASLLQNPPSETEEAQEIQAILDILHQQHKQEYISQIFALLIHPGSCRKQVLATILELLKLYINNNFDVSFFDNNEKYILEAMKSDNVAELRLVMDIVQLLYPLPVYYTKESYHLIKMFSKQALLLLQSDKSVISRIEQWLLQNQSSMYARLIYDSLQELLLDQEINLLFLKGLFDEIKQREEFLDPVCAIMPIFITRLTTEPSSMINNFIEILDEEAFIKTYMYRSLCTYILYGKINIYVKDVDIDKMVDKSLSQEEQFEQYKQLLQTTQTIEAEIIPLTKEEKIIFIQNLSKISYFLPSLKQLKNVQVIKLQNKQVDIFGQHIFKHQAEACYMVSELIILILFFYMECKRTYETDEELQKLVQTMDMSCALYDEQPTFIDKFGSFLFLVTDLLSKVSMESLINTLSKSDFDTEDILNIVIKGSSLLQKLDDYLLQNNEVLENQMLVHILTVFGQNIQTDLFKQKWFWRTLGVCLGINNNSVASMQDIIDLYTSESQNQNSSENVMIKIADSATTIPSNLLDINQRLPCMNFLYDLLNQKSQNQKLLESFMQQNVKFVKILVKQLFSDVNSISDVSAKLLCQFATLQNSVFEVQLEAQVGHLMLQREQQMQTLERIITLWQLGSDQFPRRMFKRLSVLVIDVGQRPGTSDDVKRRISAFLTTLLSVPKWVHEIFDNLLELLGTLPTLERTPSGELVLKRKGNGDFLCDLQRVEYVCHSILMLLERGGLELTAFLASEQVSAKAGPRDILEISKADTSSNQVENCIDEFSSSLSFYPGRLWAGPSWFTSNNDNIIGITYTERLVSVALPLLLTADRLPETSLDAAAELIRTLLAPNAVLGPRANPIILRITARLCQLALRAVSTNVAGRHILSLFLDAFRAHINIATSNNTTSTQQSVLTAWLAVYGSSHTDQNNNATSSSNSLGMLPNKSGVLGNNANVQEASEAQGEATTQNINQAENARSTTPTKESASKQQVVPRQNVRYAVQTLPGLVPELLHASYWTEPLSQLATGAPAHVVSVFVSILQALTELPERQTLADFRSFAWSWNDVQSDCSETSQPEAGQSIQAISNLPSELKAALESHASRVEIVKRGDAVLQRLRNAHKADPVIQSLQVASLIPAKVQQRPHAFLAQKVLKATSEFLAVAAPNDKAAAGVSQVTQDKAYMLARLLLECARCLCGHNNEDRQLVLPSDVQTPYGRLDLLQMVQNVDQQGIFKLFRTQKVNVDTQPNQDALSDQKNHYGSLFVSQILNCTFHLLRCSKFDRFSISQNIKMNVDEIVKILSNHSPFHFTLALLNILASEDFNPNDLAFYILLLNKDQNICTFETIAEQFTVINQFILKTKNIQSLTVDASSKLEHQQIYNVFISSIIRLKEHNIYQMQLDILSIRLLKHHNQRLLEQFIAFLRFHQSMFIQLKTEQTQGQFLDNLIPSEQLEKKFDIIQLHYFIVIYQQLYDIGVVHNFPEQMQTNIHHLANNLITAFLQKSTTEDIDLEMFTSVYNIYKLFSLEHVSVALPVRLLSQNIVQQLKQLNIIDKSSVICLIKHKKNVSDLLHLAGTTQHFLRQILNQTNQAEIANNILLQFLKLNRTQKEQIFSKQISQILKNIFMKPIVAIIQLQPYISLMVHNLEQQLEAQDYKKNKVLYQALIFSMADGGMPEKVDQVIMQLCQETRVPSGQFAQYIIVLAGILISQPKQLILTHWTNIVQFLIKAVDVKQDVINVEHVVYILGLKCPEKHMFIGFLRQAPVESQKEWILQILKSEYQNANK